jgi:ribonuclease-3
LKWFPFNIQHLTSNIIFFYPKDKKKLARSLKNMLGFYPGNVELYRQAFRHRSACKDPRQPSNERLEYLGDAVLNAVTGHFLFMRFPFRDEGFLTKMRSRIVSRSQLNQVAVKLGLETFIGIRGESGMRNSSVYGDAFEALVGAIFIDKGYSAANTFVLKRIIAFHLDKDYIVELVVNKEVKGTGTNFSKKRAEQNAAEEALRSL